MEVRRLQKNRRQNIRRQTKNYKKAAVCTKNDRTGDYGDSCQQPDLPIEVYLEQEEDFLVKLKRKIGEIEALEKETRFQSSSGRWMEERRKLLTASNFAKICKRRKNTSSSKLVKSLLYWTKNLQVASLNHRKNSEDIAKREMEKLLNTKIKPSGLT
ncbi:hypothetical protein TcasGA2_TC004199 [Tribolium castaneum]|uniref:Uncharacterized protein n=1 Tax=Tribolium castaneum TaxID=7070 RepID=D7EJ43_TRICA|nr:hypothetical protein TcasGA2_TC004199 [Tribolium castaneum]